MLSRKRGPPSSDISTDGMFHNRSFNFRNTKPRTGDLAAAGLPSHERGAARSAEVARGSRPSSYGKIMSHMAGVPYSSATTQQSDEFYQPRVFYQKHVMENPLRTNDFNSNGFLVFFSNDPRRARAKEYAERKNLTPVMADAYIKRVGGSPLEAVFMNTPAEVNYHLAEETAPVRSDSPMPTPLQMMKNHTFWGTQNNQAGGQEARGTDRGFAPNKLANPVIFGDCDGFNFWGDAPEHAVLWLVVSRRPREQLEKEGLMEFYLDPNSDAPKRPGESLTSRNNEWKTERPKMCENPCHMYAVWTYGMPPDVPDAYDDNGFYSPPFFLKIGRFGYQHTQSKGNFSQRKMCVDNREVLRAPKINYTLVPVQQ